jgi:hypothetical protein
VLGNWLLHQGRIPRRLEVISDSLGREPIEVLIDGSPVIGIDRPSANTGQRAGECNLHEGHLRVELVSPDDGTTVRCRAYIDGHRLSPTKPEVDVADFMPPGQRRALGLFYGVSAAAFVGT